MITVILFENFQVKSAKNMYLAMNFGCEFTYLKHVGSSVKFFPASLNNNFFSRFIDISIFYVNICECKFLALCKESAISGVIIAIVSLSCGVGFCSVAFFSLFLRHAFFFICGRNHKAFTLVFDLLTLLADS